jgi:hypothetical protein
MARRRQRATALARTGVVAPNVRKQQTLRTAIRRPLSARCTPAAPAFSRQGCQATSKPLFSKASPFAASPRSSFLTKLAYPVHRLDQPVSGTLVQAGQGFPSFIRNHTQPLPQSGCVPATNGDGDIDVRTAATARNRHANRPDARRHQSTEPVWRRGRKQWQAGPNSHQARARRQPAPAWSG